MSILYIVATPIGNLEDISLRALRVLGEVDFILCEDTRVTGKLLAHYKIKTPAISFHQHSDLKKINYILSLLEGGKDLALVTDAGTPGISDPGGLLVQAALEKFDDDVHPVKSRYAGISPKAKLFNGVKIESVPGPSAVTAALSISGIPTDKFVFMGFPPHKKGRQTFLKKILESEWPVVVYESKHRIIKFLEELDKLNKSRFINKEKQDYQIQNYKLQITPAASRVRGQANYKQIPKSKFQISKDKLEKLKSVSSVVVCRELSKMHETVYRGELKSIIEKIKTDKDAQRGEFTVIVGK